MKTIAANTGKAKYYVTAVSTALAGTKHRSTVRKVIGAFDAIGEAQGFAEAQARRSFHDGVLQTGDGCA